MKGLSIARLCYAPRGAKRLLDDIWLDVPLGTMLGVIGPNGAGKSSLLRCLYGAARPQSGVVTVGGQDLGRLGSRQRARKIAAVPQETPSDIPLSVREIVATGRLSHGRGPFAVDPMGDKAIRRALSMMELKGLAGRAFRTLSGGEKKRTMIARALAQTSEVLLLDEPVNHLDVRYQLEVLSLVRRLGITTLVALHDLDLAARYCDSLAMLHDGRLIVQGPPQQVLTPDRLRRVFEVEARVVRDNWSGSLRVLTEPLGTARAARAATTTSTTPPSDRIIRLCDRRSPLRFS